MKLRVEYPSGKQFTLEGTYRGPQKIVTGPNVLGAPADLVLIETEDGEMYALDPRGRVTDAVTGALLYDGVESHEQTTSQPQQTAIHANLIPVKSYGSEGWEPIVCPWLPGEISCVSGSGGSICAHHWGIELREGQPFGWCNYQHEMPHSSRGGVMHANIRFHKNDVGLLTAISTNATDTDDFLAAMADALQAEVKRAVHQTLHQPDGARYDGKAIDATIDLFGILLARALPQALEIGCRLRGYKADVIEHRVIVAGTILPEDMVDLVPNELADAVVPA